MIKAWNYFANTWPWYGWVVWISLWAGIGYSTMEFFLG